MISHRLMAWVWLAAGAFSALAAYVATSKGAALLFGLQASLSLLAFTLSVYHALAFDAAAKRQESH